MTKEDWAALGQKFGLHSPIKLMCDGYVITLQKHFSEEKNKVYMVIFIDGYFKGIWTNNDTTHPESKFMYEKKQTIKTHSKAEQKTLRRVFGKDKAKVFEDKVIYSKTPYYPSFAAFKKRMIAVSESIEMINE